MNINAKWDAEKAIHIDINEGDYSGRNRNTELKWAYVYIQGNVEIIDIATNTMEDDMKKSRRPKKSKHIQCYIDGVLQNSFSYRYPYQKLSFRERNRRVVAISHIFLGSCVDSIRLKNMTHIFYIEMWAWLWMSWLLECVKNKI